MRNGNFILRYQVGLIITLALVLISFEWQQFSESVIFTPNFANDHSFIEDDFIPITRREKILPPEPIKKVINRQKIIVTSEPTVIEPTIESKEPILIDVPFFEPTPVIDNTPLYTAEVPPEYPGGIDAMYEYLYKEIDYSTRCRDAGVEGTIHAQFVVGKKGEILNVEILRGIEYCKELEKEVVQAIKNMPTWKAGKQNGRNVNVYFTVPVKFKLRR